MSKINRVCVNCGKDFMARQSEVSRGKGKCCSLSCAAATSALNRNQSGELNNNWKGGISRLERTRNYRNEHPEKYQAHLVVTNAIRRKELIKAPCEVCGSKDVEGHHDDYSKPLDVRWLCKTHHIEHHANVGRGI